MSKCRTRVKRHLKSRPRPRRRCGWYDVGWTGPLVLVCSDPSDGATGVDRDVAVKLVFGREARSRRHFWDDHNCDWDHDFHDNDDNNVHQVIESIDMWQGFDRVDVNVRRLTTARTKYWDRSDKAWRRDQWVKGGKHVNDRRWDRDGCWDGHDKWDRCDRDDRWGRGGRLGRAVFLVEPVSRLRADTEYKVRVKYLDISKDGCRKRKSADMIVFETGKS